MRFTRFSTGAHGLHRLLAGSALATAVLCAPLAAQAQDAGGAGEGTLIDEGASGEILVTGSRIRGVAPVGSDVIALSTEDLNKSTGGNVVDVLKQVPQIFSTGVTDAAYQTTSGSGGSNLTRGAALNLRGINPAATLVLIDGQRITTSGVSAAFVDPSIIPTIALERIEIVADGASAIYGSDAVAGVVNIIMRKSVEGVESRFRYTFADGYERYQASALVGHDWGSGRALLGYEFSKNNEFETTERDYLVQDQRGVGGRDYRASTCNPGNILIGGVSYAIPTGNPTSGAGLVANTRNLCDIGYAQIIPRTTKHSAVGYIEQEIGNSLKASVQGFWSNREFHSRFSQQGSTLTSFQSLTVPSTNAFYILPAGSAAASQTVEYSYMAQRGPMDARGKLNAWGLFGRLEAQLGAGWRVELAGTHSANDEIIRSRTISAAAQTAALASSNPATALDPYGTRTSQAVLDAIYSGQFNPAGQSKLSTVAVRVDGSLFDLPGGAVRLAAGGEYQNGKLRFETTRGTLTAPALTFRESLREVKSGYAELFVPIFGAENETGGLHRLSLSLAARYDDYSDFGSTFNPKFGLTWKPVPDLEFRGSYGTSFRAPGLEQLLSNTVGIQVVNAVDPRSPTGRTQGLAIRDANANLGPEDAETWSIGATLKPSAVPGLTLNVNYFNLRYTGQVFGIEAADSLSNEAIYADLITRNPTTAQINAVLALGLPVLNPLPATIGFIVDSRPYNRGSTETSGLDFVVSYDHQTDTAGTFHLSANGIYFFNYDYQVTPLAPQVGRLNTIYNPLTFKGRAGLGWSKDGLSANVWANYLNAYDNTTVTPTQRVDSLTTVDFHLGYDFADGDGLFSGTSLSLDVSNLFDTNPPYVNIVTAYDPQEANALGRTVSISLRKRF